ATRPFFGAGRFGVSPPGVVRSFAGDRTRKARDRSSRCRRAPNSCTPPRADACARCIGLGLSPARRRAPLLPRTPFLGLAGKGTNRGQPASTLARNEATPAIDAPVSAHARAPRVGMARGALSRSLGVADRRGGLRCASSNFEAYQGEGARELLRINDPDE